MGERSGETLTDEEVQRLLAAARDVRLRAYAPYSGYQVGAAVLTDLGQVVGGCNVENASYPLCLCAERVALGGVVAANAGRPVAMAVVTSDGGSPCGACRQVLVEMNPEMLVIIGVAGSVPSDDGNGEAGHRVTTAAELLPGYFKLKR